MDRPIELSYFVVKIVMRDPATYVVGDPLYYGEPVALGTTGVIMHFVLQLVDGPPEEPDPRAVLCLRFMGPFSEVRLGLADFLTPGGRYLTRGPMLGAQSRSSATVIGLEMPRSWKSVLAESGGSFEFQLHISGLRIYPPAPSEPPAGQL